MGGINIVLDTKKHDASNRGIMLIKIVSVIILCMFVYIPLIAQTKIDEANIECQYDYTYAKDTLKRIDQNDRLVLLLGQKASKCYSYYSMQIDTIFASPKRDEIMKKVINFAFKSNTDYPHKRMKAYVYKNYPDGKMTVTDGLSLQDYQYEDSMNCMNWTTGDSAKTVLGYTVQDATCNFRGHKWHAWFTPDIPIMDGPWKFHGLPGLIMEVTDEKRYHVFRIVGIRNVTNMPLVFSKTYVGTEKFEKIDRRKFLKLARKYLEDSAGYVKLETGIDLDQNATIQKLKYKPLETE
jgi:Protein of unknown function (Porph_ging).